MLKLWCTSHSPTLVALTVVHSLDLCLCVYFMILHAFLFTGEEDITEDCSCRYLDKIFHFYFETFCVLSTPHTNNIFTLFLNQIGTMFYSKITKVNLSWAAIIAVGIGSFIVAKRSVDKNRVEIMRSKQRIRQAREEDNLELLQTKMAAEQKQEEDCIHCK